MPRRKKPPPNSDDDQSPPSDSHGVKAIRHAQAKRKSIPPAKIAAEGTVPAIARAVYSYNPRLAPTLRFDRTGKADGLRELLAQATRWTLTAEEVNQLTAALAPEPELEWAGKAELPAFAVDPLPLHMHERISAQAILAVAARQDVQRSLFADPEQEYREAVQFYRHDIAWTNRLILGDSLQVMASLARREDLAGKVQMIYLDPPYGIKFASNFQPQVSQRDVKDKEQDLTREPEMVKAYRDTWHLGVHSYLSYLRDRLMVARDLLADSGSIFVQIGDQNVHAVRCLLDEVFGHSNFVSLITVQKTTSATNLYLSGVADYLLWYARDSEGLKYRPLHKEKQFGGLGAEHYNVVELPDGHRKSVRAMDEAEFTALPTSARFLTVDNMQSAAVGRDKGIGAACWFPVTFEGREYLPNEKRRWITNAEGIHRLLGAGRTIGLTNTLRYARYLDDFSAFALNNIWSDLGGASDRIYIVQTNAGVVERCLLMTTDPGDLVLDPTCGSGTTAYVAEQWGRRWITIDTGRVALAIARQRLLTARFEYYKLRPVTAEELERNKNGTWLTNAKQGPHTFQYKTVPHITLKSIAQNANLDPIFARHEPILEQKLADCNAAVAAVAKEIRQKLETKLVMKERTDGKRSVTDGDRRRWLLPKDRFEHWTVPFDIDPDWSVRLRRTVTEYREAWRAKMDEVNACIAANAEQEQLVDQPEVQRGVVRVSGPFTVEAVQPAEMSLGDVVDYTQPPTFAGEPDALEPVFAIRPVEAGDSPANVEAYLERMVRLLRGDGVRFPDNKQMKFSRLEPTYASGQAHGFHAEGRWAPEGETDTQADSGPATVGVVVGPQYGPVTMKLIEDLIRPASRRYEDLVIAGFSFTAEAQALIEESLHPKLRIHVAHIRPDVNPGMNGLLKEVPGSQLFTVFGQPRTRLIGPDKSGEYRVEMEGVDIYDPVDNSVAPTRADKVAAWFLDGDYDGRTFCVTQAFFPDRSAWDKLRKALGGVIPEERFDELSGTVSLPFRAGKHRRAAVKVIDPRGNEVMSVLAIPGK